MPWRCRRLRLPHRHRPATPDRRAAGRTRGVWVRSARTLQAVGRTSSSRAPPPSSTGPGGGRGGLWHGIRSWHGRAPPVRRSCRPARTYQHVLTTSRGGGSPPRGWGATAMRHGSPGCHDVSVMSSVAAGHDPAYLPPAGLGRAGGGVHARVRRDVPWLAVADESRLRWVDGARDVLVVRPAGAPVPSAQRGGRAHQQPAAPHDDPVAPGRGLPDAVEPAGVCRRAGRHGLGDLLHHPTAEASRVCRQAVRARVEPGRSGQLLPRRPFRQRRWRASSRRVARSGSDEVAAGRLMVDDAQAQVVREWDWLDAMLLVGPIVMVVAGMLTG